jgi:hypothetical protein
MSTTETKLLLPLLPNHISEGLAAARPDLDTFRREEQAWLKDNNNLLNMRIQNAFTRSVKRHGLENAEAFMFGSLLGHRAVRLCCKEDTDMYGEAKNRHDANFDEFDRNSDRIKDENCGPWNSPESLNRLFGDEALALALMDIYADFARDAAAVVISRFAMEDLPWKADLQQ